MLTVYLRMRRLLPKCAILAGWLFVLPVASAAEIAVISPDFGDSYRNMFEQIVSGIKEKAGSRMSVVPMAEAGPLNEALHREGAHVVIALGRQGLKAASTLDRDFAVIVGGVMAAPGDGGRRMLVHTLSPDPEVLFARLKELFPGVRRVHAVSNPDLSGWQVALAREGARAQGLELVIHEEREMRSAMRAYRGIVERADAAREAIWLPQDTTTVEDGTVLPFVLNEAWAKNMVVFSSSFDHVRRGALFSLYPDNVGLGRAMGVSAVGALGSGNASGIVLSRDVRGAINLRTARHLGVNEKRIIEFGTVFRE